MQINKESLLRRIEELLGKAESADKNAATAEEVYLAAISIAASVYGEKSAQHNALIPNQLLTWTMKAKMGIGALRNIKAEINADLIPSLEKRITGAFVGDFIGMAKHSIEEGHKDVAAVLASAALEDILKKFGEINDLNLDDKEMADVINALKSKALLQGAQAKVAASYVTLRNKAFHAQWDKIDTPEVRSLIGFVEEFVIKNFT